MTQLTGRVFSRLQQYDALPTELKREVEALEQHLTATQRDVFSSHPTLKLKTVHGVKTDALLEKIEAWYKLHGKEFSQTHSHGVGHGHHGTATGAATGTATGKAHAAAHNAKEDVKHAVGRDTTYDQTHGTGHGVTRDQTYGTDHGVTRDQTYGTGHGVTRDQTYGTGHGATTDPTTATGKVHNAAHNVKEDVKHAMGRDNTYDPNYDQTRGYAPTGDNMGRNYDGTGRGVTGDRHHGTGHGVAHDVKQDVKHAMGRDHTYDQNYDQTRGNYDTATGAPTSAAHTAGTAGTAAGAGAMTGAGPATHQTTPNTTAAHSTNPNVGNYQVGGSATPATAPVQPVQTSHMHGGALGGSHSHAKQLLDALVLKGFVTPHKEPKPEDAGVPTPTKHTGTTTTGALIKDLELSGNTLLVARAPSIADEKTKEKGPSVWDVVDGAVFAGMVKRKAGLIEKVIHGKETYVVVNERLHSLTVFKSDVSRKSITQLFNRGLQVAFDDSHAEHGYSHGVKVWNGADSELLFTTSQQERDALARALVQIGASQNGVRGIDAAPTGMKAKADKMGHDVKHAVGADRRHETHGQTTATHNPHHANKHVGEGIMGAEHRGYHEPTTATASRSATHTSDNMMKTTPEGGVETHQYQQPSHHHGMDKLGLGDHHQPQQQQYQPQQQQYQQQYQQNPQHGMTADNAHVKRDVGPPRGYTQGIEPSVAP